MSRTLLLLGMLCLAATMQAAAAEVYKWVDKDGAVHYGDRPPDAGPAQQVNAASLPLPLQSRLRSLDPYFVITKFGGNIKVGYVCGEYDKDAAGPGGPQFPAQVEGTNLGAIRVGGSFDHVTSWRGNFYPTVYDNEKCGRVSFKDTRKVQRTTYEIRFNPDAVRAYQGVAESGGK